MFFANALFHGNQAKSEETDVKQFRDTFRLTLQSDAQDAVGKITSGMNSELREVIDECLKQSQEFWQQQVVYPPPPPSPPFPYQSPGPSPPPSSQLQRQEEQHKKSLADIEKELSTVFKTTQLNYTENLANKAL